MALTYVEVKSMKTIPFSEFRVNCHSLIEHVRKTRKPIVITRKGEILAEIHPCPVHLDEDPGNRGDANTQRKKSRRRTEGK
jgi:hypothetical protein